MQGVVARVRQYSEQEVEEDNEVKECAGFLNFLAFLGFLLSSFWAMLARGTHPFPSRTRKLSPSAPMVLHARVCGRVGSRPIKLKKPRSKDRGFCVLLYLLFATGR